MKSKTPELDLDTDLPTTEDDVVALRRIKEERRVDFADYLRWLSKLELPASRRPRKTHDGFEPFEL